MPILTAYPEAGGGGANVTCDGRVSKDYTAGAGVDWSVIRGLTDGDNAYNNQTTIAIYFRCDTTTSKYRNLTRSFLTFATPVIGSVSRIVSAVISLCGQSKADTNSYAPNANIYGSTQANANDVAVGDFDQAGAVAFCDTPISYAGVTLEGYNALTLNPAGIAALVLNGVSKFAIKNVNYDEANNSPTWVNGKEAGMWFYAGDEAGSTKDPKLVMTYENADVIFFGADF